MANDSRSPNYPSLSLREAIEAMRAVYSKERRAKFPRLALVRHLGYTSINGRSLRKIGALRAYGLLDGREDQLSVSPEAIALLEAPEGDPAKTNALRKAFLSPPLFQRINEEYPNTPSHETLRWWIIQQGFSAEASDKVVEVYLDSKELVSQALGEHSPAPEVDPQPAQPQVTAPAVVRDTRQLASAAQVDAPKAFANPIDRQPDFIVKLGDGRVAVIEIRGGEAEARHLRKLGRFIRLQEMLLADEDDTDEHSGIQQ